jgi:hypothetical protein
MATQHASPSFNFTGPSSPPATPTTATATMNSRRHGMNFSGAISAQLRDEIIPNGNMPLFSHNPFQALDTELSPRSSSPASSVHSSSSSETDDPHPLSRSPTPGRRFTSTPPSSQARTRIVSEGNFTLKEFDEHDYEAFDSDAESIIRPHQYEDAESDRAHSARGHSPGRDIDPAILHKIRDLHCDEPASFEERETWLKEAREERRKKRRSSGSVQKRSLAQSIGSDTDDEDLQPGQFDANEAGSSARRLRRKVAGERSSLIFDDPPPRIEELEEPESCEEVVDVADDEQGLRQLPYYEQVMDVDSEDDD